MSRTPSRRVAPAAALLALAGCSIGPAYERPALDVPAAFRATDATAAASWPDPLWWRGFRSAELDGLILRARAYNQDLAAAAARVVQADARARVAGAPLLPSLNATANFSYRRSGITGGGRSSAVVVAVPTGGIGSTTSTAVTTTAGSRYFDVRSYSAGLQVAYDTDFWGRNRALAESARIGALASRFDQEVVALNVVTSVANAYFQALAAQDRLRVAERNLADAERVLSAFRGRLEAGTASALDVSQQEALVAAQRATIPALRDQFEQQAIALGILTGTPPENLTVRGGTLDKLPSPAVSPGLPSELLARRPDVAAAETNLVAQDANIRAARAAFFPQIQLTVAGGLQSTALSAITGPGTLVASLAAGLTQAIFDNGSRRGQLEFERARYDELLATYRQSVLQAFTDTEQALAALRYTTEQEALVRRTVATAQRSADIARAQLQAGTIDVVTALNTQNTLFTQLDLLTQVRLARFQALVNLYKALGGGWTAPKP